MMDGHRDGCLCNGCMCARYELEIYSMQNDLESLRTKLMESEANFDHVEALYKEAADHAQEYREDMLEVKKKLAEVEKDAAKWRAYQKRKLEVIAAGMGKNILRDIESHDALPAFYAAMKEQP